MCGINAIVSKNERHDLAQKIDQMNTQIIHRGPDEDGVYLYNDRIAIGMRRLSIIDLSTGKQPMYNDRRNLSIVYNGEVYNYKELKSHLEGLGVLFHTTSDTEVVLKLYEKYKEESLQMLNGVFAFAIYDTELNQLFVARDRFGEKPVYYYSDSDQLLIASELKSIVKVHRVSKGISKEALNLYLNLNYIPAPYTIYENIFKLPPASYLKFNCVSMKSEICSYWKSIPGNGNFTGTYGEAKNTVKQLLFDSVNRRMIADVPVGTFLSGGVDSSIVTAIASKVSSSSINTFSIGYSDPRYDESKQAELVAKHCNTNHQSFILDYNDLIHDVDKVLLNYDEPFADSSALPTYFVSKMARQYVKVALTGDGGDETFGGYNRYLIKSYTSQYTRLVPQFIHKHFLKGAINAISSKNESTRSKTYQIKKLVNAVAYTDLGLIHNIMSLGFSVSEMSKVLKKDYLQSTQEDIIGRLYREVESKDYLSKARYIDRYFCLEGDMNVKVDRASFLASLEARTPMLDHRLVEFTDSLPENFLINGKNKKRILKETFADLLPVGLFDMPKKGFEIPIGQWLRNELCSDFKALTNKELIQSGSVLEYDYIQKLFKEHLTGYRDHSFKLWSIYCFQKWITSNS